MSENQYKYTVTTLTQSQWFTEKKNNKRFIEPYVFQKNSQDKLDSNYIQLIYNLIIIFVTENNLRAI